MGHTARLSRTRCVSESPPNPKHYTSSNHMDQPPSANTSVAARLLYEELHRECQQLRQSSALQEEATLEAQRAATMLEARLAANTLASNREVASGHDALAAASKREQACRVQLDEASSALRATQVLLEQAQAKALEARKEARAEAAARESALREALQTTRDAVRGPSNPCLDDGRSRRLEVDE